MAEPIKNAYGANLAESLGARIQRVYPAFPVEAFVQQVAAQVGPLELKERVAVITQALRQHLPPDYADALAILTDEIVLGPELVDESKMYNEGYGLLPVATFVEFFGLEHFDESMQAAHAITRRFSAEFTIRPFLAFEPERTLDVLHGWIEDPNPHVRRLVSEGTRPRLPWASYLQTFISDPAPVLALLEKLRGDPSEYVRRSVANNLNDIAKDHPDLVMATLEHWQADTTVDVAWITRRALRSLVKQGNPRALALLGYHPAQVTLDDLRIAPDVITLGESFELSFTLTSAASEPQNLMIDFVVHFVRSKGKTSEKVFKLKTATLAPGETLAVSKRHPIKPITVRRYYAGVHVVDVQVNGARLGSTSFTLEM